MMLGTGGCGGICFQKTLRHSKDPETMEEGGVDSIGVEVRLSNPTEHRSG